MNWLDFEIKMTEESIKMYKKFMRWSGCITIFNLAAAIMLFTLALMIFPTNMSNLVCLGSLICSFVYSVMTLIDEYLDFRTNKDYLKKLSQLKMEDRQTTYLETLNNTLNCFEKYNQDRDNPTKKEEAARKIQEFITGHSIEDKV